MLAHSSKACKEKKSRSTEKQRKHCARTNRRRERGSRYLRIIYQLFSGAVKGVPPNWKIFLQKRSSWMLHDVWEQYERVAFIRCTTNGYKRLILTSSLERPHQRTLPSTYNPTGQTSNARISGEQHGRTVCWHRLNCCFNITIYAELS